MGFDNTTNLYRKESVKAFMNSYKMDFDCIMSSLTDSNIYEEASVEIFMNFFKLGLEDRLCLHDMCKEYLQDGDMLEYKNNTFLWDSHCLIPIKNDYKHDELCIEQLYLDKYDEDHFLYV